MTWWMQCWYVIERGMGKSEEYLSPPPEGPHSWVKRRALAMVWRTYPEAKAYLAAHQRPGVLEGARLGYIDPALAVNLQSPPVSLPIAQATESNLALPATSPRSRKRPRPVAKARRKAAAIKNQSRAKAPLTKRRKAK